MLDLLTKAVPNTEAAAFIRNKPIVSRQVYDRMLPEVQALSFTISGVERYDVLQRVRDLTAELPLGGDWNKIKRGIAAELSPWLGDEKAAKARAELILRHHGLQSYRVSQWEQVQRNTDVYPYLKYIATRDGKTRSSHQALHGVILPVDDPFWQGHMPPWEWGCRCQVIQVSQAQYDAQLAKDKDLPLDERKVLDKTARARLNDEGRFVHARRDSQDRLQPPQNFDVRTPQQKGNRGPGTVEDLRIPMEVLRDRYDDDIWQEFEGWARKEKLGDVSIFDWLEGAELPAAAEIFQNVGTGGTIAGLVRGEIEAAKFTSATPMGGGVNTTIKLENGKTVVFKPASGERDGLRPGIPDGSQYKREKAASVVDEYFGLHLVPPTTIREYGGELGSMQLFNAEGADIALAWEKRGVHPIAALSNRQRRDWHLLDYVLGHQDRHVGNYMLRKRRAQGYDLILIDNGLSLGELPKVYFRASPAGGMKLNGTDRKYLRKFLRSEGALREQLGNLLDPTALDLMIARAQKLLNLERFENP